MELDIPPSPPPVEITLAERRARRQAILAKYAGASSTSFELAKDNEQGDAQVKVQAQNGNAEQISAADYDPSLDRREDEQKRVYKDELMEEEIIEEEEDDDVDDMFAVAKTEKKVKKVRKVMVSNKKPSPFTRSYGFPFGQKPTAPALITTSTLDSAADPEGYYQVILGEQLDGGRYQVFSSLGKGMFANVVRARVLHGEVGESGKEVAIKIVRHQESMYVL